MELIRCLLLCLLALPAWGAGLPAPVTQALRQANIPAGAVALMVQRVDQAHPLVAVNADKPMSPASTMKLLTTYAALELLGPAYTWKTEAYADAPIQDGVLDGNLILKGYGDPSLTLERFHALVRTLRNRGLREIRGDLVLDNRWFQTTAADPGAFDGEPYRAYNALPDALLVNFKATQFSFTGDAAGGKVNIVADPALPGLNIVNQVELRQVPCADWKDRVGYHVQTATNGSVTVTFSGNYSVACGEKSLELSVIDNAAYVHALFRELWQEQGGQLRGSYRQGATPASAIHLATAVSPPLAEVIRMVNKFSNNVMARQLLLTIAAETQGAPGTADHGIAAIRNWLAKKSLDFPELVLDNGAGLSRLEQISARHLAQLLLAAWQSPVMPELMSSLPIVATDGTLERRLQNADVAGHAHLKTGSLDGVRAIAGYVLDREGKRWAVVMLVNHSNAGASRAAQDALLEWVYDRR